MPTLNSERVLEECLWSVGAQDYPRDSIDVVVADGGSTDRTIEIITSFKAKFADIRIGVVANPLATGEAGKAAGLREATGEIVAFVDSDNVLPASDWLRRMVAPFADPSVVASEPIEYTLRQSDGYLTRYGALLGMNDPLCYFLGNYDRRSALSGRWTEVNLVSEEDCGDYVRVTLDPRDLPTIGANGFLVRRDVLLDSLGQSAPEYLFDVDVLWEIGRRRSLVVAKVKTGIVHVQAGNIRTFVRKQRRRIRDYQYYSALNIRRYPWKKQPVWRLAKFVVYSASVVPLVVQTIRGYWRRPDRAWFFHPVANIVTLWVYGVETIRGMLGVRPAERGGWSQ